MREILFRGKRVDNGGWVEGGFCGKNCNSPFGPMEDQANIIKYDALFSGFWFEVDHSTVGQYTGLVDKNGKKIFEGDILKDKRRHVFRMEYCVPTSCFVARATNGVPYVPSLNTGTIPNYEVIGNIHDNPELWEEAENDWYV